MQTKQKDTTLSNLFFSLPQIRTARPQPAYETHGRVEQDLQAESTSFAYQKNETHTHKKNKLVKKIDTNIFQTPFRVRRLVVSIRCKLFCASWGKCQKIESARSRKAGTHARVCKVSRLCVATCSLVFNVSPLTLKFS